jgi:small conductance mechanosensitive channel
VNELIVASSENLLPFLGRFLLITVRMVFIVLISWQLVRLAHLAINRLSMRLTKKFIDGEAIKRVETLGRVLHYVITVVVSLWAGMLLLSEIGVSFAPILGAAGIVGLAVGFGAQSLVKDYFTGFFLLLEDQIRQGDVVKIDGHTGLVESVTLRYVRLRDYFGDVYFIPNSQIASVVNMTRGFSYAVMDARVGYREDIDQVIAVMHEVSRGLRKEPEFGKHILDHLEMAGVNELADSVVFVRARLKCVAIEKWGIQREFIKRLKVAFDQAQIEVPFPHLTLVTDPTQQELPPSFAAAAPPRA